MKRKIHYSDYTTDLFEYDFSIASHVLIDACNASIIYRLVENLDFSKELWVLDAGCGTGQVARLLSGIKGINVEACDIDPAVEEYFKANPETKNIPYYHCDIINKELPRKYDAIILRGVYHHIAKGKRPKLLKTLCEQTDLLICADEGILEYKNEKQRLEHCDVWYKFVIDEAKRRKLYALAIMESDYVLHEKLNTADDGGDLKESPEEFKKDCKKANIVPFLIDRFGDWNFYKGGFYTAIIKNGK